MPIVHLAKLFKELEIGEEITAVATDPAFHLDVETWCMRTGNELLELVENEGHLTAKIRKANNSE